MKTLIQSLLIVTIALSGCAPGPESPKGFVLPKGDIDRGLQAYQDLQCGRCHKLNDTAIAYTGNGQPVLLGGDTTRVKHYGDLLTSIVNPSHKIAPGVVVGTDGESPMADAYLNQLMTVQQLIDLVTFLQPQYKIVIPPHSPFMHY